MNCGGFREISALRSGVAEFRAPQWVALAKQMDFKWSVRRCALQRLHDMQLWLQ